MQNFTAPWMSRHSGQCFPWKCILCLQNMCRKKEMTNYYVHHTMLIFEINNKKGDQMQIPTKKNSVSTY